MTGFVIIQLVLARNNRISCLHFRHAFLAKQRAANIKISAVTRWQKIVMLIHVFIPHFNDEKQLQLYFLFFISRNSGCLLDIRPFRCCIDKYSFYHHFSTWLWKTAKKLSTFMGTAFGMDMCCQQRSTIDTLSGKACRIHHLQKQRFSYLASLNKAEKTFSFSRLKKYNMMDDNLFNNHLKLCRTTHEVHRRIRSFSVTNSIRVN
uniref:Secreted protein n=1 Tax=Heterorhabditis bacteriophora TaxID=37862 RepID=A0A1I7WA59_HETBA